MLPTYDFTVDKFSKMIANNLECRGNKSIEWDANIIYYYLSQKYSDFEIREFMKNIDKIMNMTQKSIQNKLLLLADDNYKSPIT